MPILVAALRLLAISIGILAYYAAFFMYEDQQGKWQNRIEELWVAIHDMEKMSGSMTSAFFNKVSVVVTRAFDRIFGSKLFSFRALGVSTSYSLAGSFLSGFVAFTILLLLNNRLDDPLPEGLVKHWSLVEAVCLLGTTLFFLIGLLPSLSPSRWFVRLSLLPVYFFGFGMLLELIERPHGPHKQLAFSSALLASFLSDIFWVALVRFTVRWIIAKTNVFRIACAVLIQLGVIILLVDLPAAVGEVLIDTYGPLPAFKAVGLVAALNVFAGLASSLFFLTLLFVLLHRVFWPVLGRVLYPLARQQVIHNRGIMLSVGTACFIFAFPSMSNAVKGVLERLAK
jgi:hypothetical protein